MQDFTKFRQNLNRLKKEKGWNNKDLGLFAGVTDQIISNWLTGRTPEPPLHSIKELCNKAGVNYSWLMGDDSVEMFSSNLTLAAEGDSHLTYRKAKAGHTISSNHRVQLRGLLAGVIDELPEGVYEVFEVDGSSMETSLTQGDRLICQATDIESILDNRVYVLVLSDPRLKAYRESGIWIKRCNHRKENGYISCRSDNKDTTEPFPTFRVKSEYVQEVWYPVLKITAHLSDPNREMYNRMDELEARIEMLEDLLDVDGGE